MAEKGFGAKEINLIGSSGTPTIESPGNLNLNANNVAISTNVSIGGTLSVTGNISVGGTLTYEDVTNIDSVGLITARSGLVSPFADIDDFLDVGSNIQLGNAGVITATTFSGSATAVRVIAANSVAATVYPTFAGSGATQAGDLNIKTDNSLTYNSLSGELTAVKFTGDGSSLTGIAVTEAPVVDYTITGDGSNYYFHGGGVDGSAGDPDLYLIRGQKYRFNNTTGSGHPFRFTSTGNANAAYSNGVTGSENGIQFWTIPYDAPAKLFYVCTIHSGMVGNIYIRGANGQNDNVGLTTFKDNVSIVKSSPILELSTNTVGNDASIRLHESTPGSTSNGGGMFYSGADNKLHITCGTTLTSKRITILRDDGKVGINEESPDSLLHLTTNNDTDYSTSTTNTSNQTNTLLRLENTSGSDGSGVNNYVGIYFRVGSGANSDSQLQYVRTGDNAGAFHFKARNASSTYPNLMTIDSRGAVTKPNLPSFHARPPASYSLGDNVNAVVGGTWSTSGTGSFVRGTLANGNSIWNNTNGIFTVPVTGIYFLHWTVFLSNNSTRRDAFIYLNGTNTGNIIARTEIQDDGSGMNKSVAVSTVISLSVNDTVRFGARTAGGTTIYTTAAPWSYACGHLVG